MSYTSYKEEKEIEKAEQEKEFLIRATGYGVNELNTSIIDKKGLIVKLKKILSKKYSLENSDYIILIDKFKLDNTNITKDAIKELISYLNMDLKLKSNDVIKQNIEDVLETQISNFTPNDLRSKSDNLDIKSVLSDKSNNEIELDNLVNSDISGNKIKAFLGTTEGLHAPILQSPFQQTRLPVPRTPFNGLGATAQTQNANNNTTRRNYNNIDFNANKLLIIDLLKKPTKYLQGNYKFHISKKYSNAKRIFIKNIYFSKNIFEQYPKLLNSYVLIKIDELVNNVSVGKYTNKYSDYISIDNNNLCYLHNIEGFITKKKKLNNVNIKLYDIDEQILNIQIPEGYIKLILEFKL